MKRDPVEASSDLIRRELSGDVDPSAHVRARARFVEAATRSSEQRLPGWRSRMLVAAGAVALVSALALVAHGYRAPLTFTRGIDRAPAAASEYLVAPHSEELPIYFSDGSVVTLDPEARARVQSTTRDGSVLLVESGRLAANIVHRTTSDWYFLVGPYSVHVTGTAFVLTWGPEGSLDIEMRSGRVVVTGPGAERGVEVRDHGRFLVPGSAAASPGEAATTSGPVPAPSSVAAQIPGRSTTQSERPRDGAVLHSRVPPAPGEPSPARGETPDTETELAPPAVPAESPSWSALVARGEYARVVELSRERGVEATLDGAPEEELGALADAARFSGETAIASQALHRIRSRFPGTPRAGAAAFLLGRLADDAGSGRTAVSWYDIYLSETPGGALAAEAMGRRMLALRRMNDLESARSAAREYLGRFPKGPHANIARDILGS